MQYKMPMRVTHVNHQDFGGVAELTPLESDQIDVTSLDSTLRFQVNPAAGVEQGATVTLTLDTEG